MSRSDFRSVKEMDMTAPTPRPFRARLISILSSITVAMLVGIIVQPWLVAAPVAATDKTYTLDADFDLGVLFNVNHDAPNNDQLQLNTTLTTFPVMWIANAGEDTLSKFDTNLNVELARYRSDFHTFDHLGNAYAGPAPSRTAVDANGNAYVANRHFDGLNASVMKVLTSDFIDRNGDGMVQTSTGSVPLPLVDTNADGIVQDSEIQDERVAWIVQVPGTAGQLGRSLCLDPNDDLWAGMHFGPGFGPGRYFKLDPANGMVLAGPVQATTHNPYGCVVDSSGMLWSASLSSTLGQLNTNTASWVATHAHNRCDYGIAQGNSRIYQSDCAGRAYIQFDPGTNTFALGPANYSGTTGMAVDAAGDILAGQFGGVVGKFMPDGTNVWISPAGGGTAGSHGTIVDSNGDVWRINLFSANMTKYRGTDGAMLGVFPIGDSPYTYSDATGLGARTNTSPSGTWTVVQDSGMAAATWASIAWNTEPQGSETGGSSITVEARAAETEAGLGAQTYVPVTNGGAPGVVGRYIQVRATLTAGPMGTSPVLSDLRITSNVVDFEFPEGGVFVIGDEADHATGARVNFWGAQWAQNNPVSGEASPGHNSFKGFANSPEMPDCGDTWMSRPGNSSDPPDGPLPSAMGVIVTSNVVKDGPNLSGIVEKIIVVTPEPDYGPSPGHRGYGMVTSVVCTR